MGVFPKYKYIALFLMAGFVFIFTKGELNRIYAMEEDFLRIGIESLKNKSNIPIGNNGVNIYLELENEFADFGRIEGSDLNIINAASKYFVITDDVYNNYEDALDGREDYNEDGIPAVPVLNQNGQWVLYLGGFDDRSEASYYEDSGFGKVTQLNSGSVAVLDDDEYLAVMGASGFTAYFADEDSKTVNINGNDYRGYLEAYCGSSSSLTAVNVVSAEDYLYSAVSSEMPSAWHIEALKAQAVAARSYTYTRKGVHKDAGYDLCDNIHCQIYLGISGEAESSFEAVDGTSKEVAYYNDEIINATFFSSSGGMTDDSENVWADTIGYLRGVSDEYEEEAKQWSRSFSLDELTVFAENRNLNIGSVTGVAITEISETGRVIKMRIEGTANNVTLEKEDVRTFFSGSQGGSLESRNFMIGEYTGYTGRSSSLLAPEDIYLLNGEENKDEAEEVIFIMDTSGNTIIAPIDGDIHIKSNAASVISSRDKVNNEDDEPTQNQDNVNRLTSSSDDIITFSGRGWGHGVGLSQFGAKGMAEAGFDYEEILTHYFRGIEIRKRD